MLNALKLRKSRAETAKRLCAAVATRARADVFFLELGVADTIDGRFDLVVLHAWMVLDALQDRSDTDTAGRFVDLLFIQFDEALRELGAGDIGMARRMRRMAQAFHGRLKAYREAPNVEALARAIARNLYRGTASGVEPSNVLANYCVAARAQAAQSRVDAGEIEFGPLPGNAG